MEEIKKQKHRKMRELSLANSAYNQQLLNTIVKIQRWYKAIRYKRVFTQILLQAKKNVRTRMQEFY